MSDSPDVLSVILMFVGFALLFLVVFGSVLFFITRAGKATSRAWSELATRTGLTLKPASMFSFPELNGTFRGRPMRLYTYSSGTQRNRQTYTAVGLTLKNPVNATLEITPASAVGSFFGKLVKAQDVEIGNAEIDGRFVIKSDPADFAMKVLGSISAQLGIMAIPDAFRIVLEGQSLRYSKRGVERDPELLMKVFNTLSDLAEDIER